MMGSTYQNPASLSNLCIESFCNFVNYEYVKPALPVTFPPKYFLCFKNDVFIPNPIAERLLTSFSKKGILNCITSTLFDSKSTRLRYVEAPKASCLNFIDLKIFCQHHLNHFHIEKSNVPANEILAEMNEWTYDNLEVLNMSRCNISESFKKPYRHSINLEVFKNLRELDVSHTEFHSHNLVAIVEDLQFLESLNISNTKVDCIAPLRKCKHKLKKLGVASLQLTPTCQVFPFCAEGPTDIVLSMTNLQHLDVSFDRGGNIPFEQLMDSDYRHIFNIIDASDKLPNLVSLDVSGQNDISEKALFSFLQMHPHLQFLGLMHTNVSSSKMFDPSDSHYGSRLKISGTGYLEQVIVALKVYQRHSLVQHCLYTLYSLSELNNLGPRPDIIEIVIDQMKIHNNVFSIQLACTACLYNLTKCGMYDNYNPGSIPQNLLAVAVSLTLDAMEKFPENYQLQKNALLTLCNDRILQETPMDRFRCAQLVLNTFCCFNNEQTDRLCVAISSIVASKISSKETAMIGSERRYMKKLLHIVKRKEREGTVDSTLGFALSTLWNLSDESPHTCTVFLEQGGMYLFIDMLNTYKNNENVLTKILGLLNNIAEVEGLRKNLMKDEIIESIRSLLKSSSIEISYFSGGVFAHLVSSGADKWYLEDLPRHLILQELETAILSWEQANKEMVAYRSFRPFLPLLQCFETYQAQLWALWAIQHVLTAHGQRYSEMLTAEGICQVLDELTLRFETNELVRSRASVILEQLRDFKAKKITAFKF